jgi:predicted N-acetyltransferase YhbS
VGKVAGGKPPDLSAPERLSPAHNLSQFDCGDFSLNDRLKKRAMPNNGRTSQTFVIQIGGEVIGYYSLTSGAVERDAAPSKLKRNSVDPIPVVVLGRLAVHEKHKGKGLGADLLRDAVLRSIRIAEDVGVCALLVQAIDDDAAAFYRRFNFLPSPIGEGTLMLPPEAARAML